MKFYTSLYVGASVKKPKKVIRQLKSGHGLLLSDTHVITFAHGTDQLEIFSAKYLLQPYYKKNPPFVVGISKGYDEAVELVTQIVQESINTRGDCDLKTYLMERSPS